MQMPESLRPFSTSSSVISPYAALEAIAGSEHDPGSIASSSSTGYTSGHARNPSSTLSARPLTSPDERRYSITGESESDNDDVVPIFLVRARFDFDAPDLNALSFRQGDLIQVVQRLESGWWDGMLGAQRGWFPSNFVEDVSDEDIRRYDEEQMRARAMARRAASRDTQRGGEREGSRDSNGYGYGSSEEDVLRMDDVLRGHVDLEDWGGDAGLEQLAREMMAGPHDVDDNDDDDGRLFEQEAMARRRRHQLAAGMSGGDKDEFGVRPRREREETDATITSGTFRGAARLNERDILGSERGQQTQAQTLQTLEPKGGEGKGKGRETVHGQPQDAWIPSLTPDGQVYYHNTYTGEDSWEMPLEAMAGEDESYEPPDDEMYKNFSPTSATALDFTSSLHAQTPTPDDDFRPPPKVTGDIPYPWIAKLSDDGREWFYHNRLTGQSRRDPPTIRGDATSMLEVGQGVKRMSVSSGPRPLRASVELQRKAVEEWEKKTAEALRAVVQPLSKPTMGLLMETVNEALREIFEAAVAGSAAEEEMSRAEDLGSESGMAAAIMREESAVEMLAMAHSSTLEAIREILGSFGYVGPLDKMEELPRPPWVGDMTLIGSIGLLSANTHAAVVSRKQPESGLSVWAEVMRSASKLKDVIANFPGSVSPGSGAGSGVSQAEQDNLEGKRVQAWLGIELVCSPMNGKWGFGKSEQDLKTLDQAAVMECQKIRQELDDALQHPPPLTEDSILDALRLATRFNQSLLEIDLASTIDFDGDAGELRDGIRAREADLREYDMLVSQARQALQDLDIGVRNIDQASIQLLYRLSLERPETDSTHSYDQAVRSLSQVTSTTFRALSTLLIIAGEQLSAVEQGLIRGQIGVRSGRYVAPLARSTRRASVVSSTSRMSRSSRSTATTTENRRSRVRGLEEEFLDQEPSLERDLDEESRDRAGDMPPPPSASASASSSSLAKQVSRLSATSSTTSLAYQQNESDRDSLSAGGSERKGNRTSILKAFRRNRAGSDVDDGRNKTRTPSKKLAKLLGEDVSAIPNLNFANHRDQRDRRDATVPPPSQPEAPWYLSDDFVPGEIVFDDKGGVKAGTLRALVVRLTQHSSTDTPFFQAFLLTFRSFTNGDELFTHLIDRYNLSPPDGLTPDQLNEWKIKKQALVRLRVANALRTWLEKHYVEQSDRGVLDRIERFAETTLVANGSELMSKQLLTLVAKRRQGEPDLHIRRGQTGLLSPPAPLVPRVQGRQMRLTDISPLEIARQLTILEFTNFSKIKPSECFARHVASDDTVAPNVRRVINTANRLAGWVSLHCLGSRDARVRAGNMKIMIQVAAECRNLNNFSGMAGIVAGLNSAPITRLKRTKELLSQKSQALKAELDRALDTSKNFSNYRDMLKTVNPPCVPFFGFYLSALTFIQDGNKDFIQPGALNNNNNGQSSKSGMTNSNSSSSLSSINRPSPLSLSTTSITTNGTNGTNPGSSTTNTNANGSTTADAAPIPPVSPVPLINFFKRALNAEILRDISQYQSQPYNLAKCKPVWEFLEREFEEVEKGQDLWELSMMLEPREKEEERITRMLHDSGFI